MRPAVSSPAKAHHRTPRRSAAACLRAAAVAGAFLIAGCSAILSDHSLADDLVPRMQMLERQVAQLESELAVSDGAAPLVERVATLEAELANLQRDMDSTQPAVIRLSRIDSDLSDLVREIETLTNRLQNPAGGGGMTMKDTTLGDTDMTGQDMTGQDMTDGFGLHIASYKSRAAAENGWQIFMRRHAVELSALAPVIRQVDVAGKGRFFRLIGASLDNRRTAAAICEALKAQGTFCDVVRL